MVSPPCRSVEYRRRFPPAVGSPLHRSGLRASLSRGSLAFGARGLRAGAAPTVGNKQVEDPAHIAALSEAKRQGRHHRGADRLFHAAPNRRALLSQAAARGQNLGSLTASLSRLFDRHGAAELEAAIGEALSRGVPHPNAVRLALERHREQRDQAPPLAVELPEDPRVKTLVVKPHKLNDYDQLQPHPENDDDDNDQ